jgi:hypothetical protein
MWMSHLQVLHDACVLRMFPLSPPTASNVQNRVTPLRTREEGPKIKPSSFTGWHAYIQSQKYRIERPAATTKQGWGNMMKLFTQTRAAEWKAMTPQQKQIYNNLAAEQRAARQEALEKTQNVHMRLEQEVPPSPPMPPRPTPPVKFHHGYTKLSLIPVHTYLGCFNVTQARVRRNRGA